MFIAVCVCVLCLELGIRVLNLSPDIFLQQDPVLGVWHIPNKQGVYFRQDVPETPVFINSQGLRDHEYSYAKPAHTYRIAIVGDSFSEAIQVPLEHTYHQILETRLNSEGNRKYEVINFGVGGFGTTHEYLMFIHQALNYQPDMVLLQFMFGNDIYENSPALNGRAYLPFLVPDKNGALELVPPAPVPLYMRLGAQFHIVPFLYYRIIDGNSTLETLLRGIKRGSADTGIPHEYFTYKRKWDSNWQDAWYITTHVLRQLLREIQEHEMQFLIVGFPEQIQVDPQIRNEVMTRYPAMQEKNLWDWEKPNKLLAAFCKAHEIPLLDLAPIFQESIRQGAEPLYYHYDGHWNPRGHQLAADQLSQFLDHLIP